MQSVSIGPRPQLVPGHTVSAKVHAGEVGAANAHSAKGKRASISLPDLKGYETKVQVGTALASISFLIRFPENN